MRVCTLTAIPDTDYFDNCTLIFKTLRTGFPTADIHVTINKQGLVSDQQRAFELAKAAGANHVRVAVTKQHHPDWIRGCVESCSDEAGPLVIIDSDIHFWKSCEDWKFNAPIAGYYVPEMLNDWSLCRSVPKLHTSFLWINQPRSLLEQVSIVNPLRDEFTQCDPFRSSIQWLNGEPIYWDTCAVLYNMIGGAHFGPEHIDCYEHLNSASYVKAMIARMGGQTGKDFELFHALATKDMNFVKTFCWPIVQKYYVRKQAEARLARSTFRKETDFMKL